MISKRKFLSILAILFALVFALSVCFFAACGSKDDDEKGSDTTTEQGGGTSDDDGSTGGTTEDEESQGGTTVAHEHNYVVDDSTWTFSEDYSTCTATAKCTTTEGTCDAPTKTVEAVVTSNAVSATCTTAGTVTYVATYGDKTVKTSEEVQTGSALGHDVTATWDESTSGWVYTCSRNDTVATDDAIASIAYMAGSADALESALERGGAVKLTGDVVGTFTVSANTTLDLAGHSITDGGVAPVAGTVSAQDTITVTEGASLTITNSGETGAIVNTYTGASSVDNAEAIYSEGNVILDGGAIEAESVGIRADAGEVIINGGSISAGYTGIWMSRGVVTVTVNNGKIECEQKAIYVGGDGDFGETGTFHPGAVTTLNVYGGEIESSLNSAIVTLGTCNKESAVINIYGGKITSKADAPRSGSEGNGNPMPAVYVPSGTLNISGTADSAPVITGSTAVEIRGGTTKISGGEFNVLDGLQYTQNHAYETSNATTYGYALAVFPYGSGVKNNGSVIDNTVNVQVAGGVFDGDVFGSTQEDHTKTTYTWAEYTFTITGGTFSSDPSSYVDESCTVIGNAEKGFTVVSLSVNFSNVDFSAVDFATSGSRYDLVGEAFVAHTEGNSCIFSYYSFSGDSVKEDTTGLPEGSTYTTGLQFNGNTKKNLQRVIAIDLSSIVEEGKTVTIQVVGTCDARETKQSQIILTQAGQLTSDVSSSTTALAASTAVTSNEIALAEAEDTKETNQYVYRTVEYVVGSGSEDETNIFYVAGTQTVRIYAINIIVSET